MTDNRDPQASEKRFKDTVAVGESVEVKMSGKWEDGNGFEAYDCTGIKNARVHHEH